jgi:hypothetical protein
MWARKTPMGLDKTENGDYPKNGPTMDSGRMAIETPIKVMASTTTQSNSMDVSDFCDLPDESGGEITCTGI